MKHFFALFAGMLFSLGLTVGGMTQPAIVLGFLDVLGDWNAQLLFVMAAAVVTTAVGYRMVFRLRKPMIETAFHLPKARRVDGRLIGGAALFGTGWGIGGYCPGPAIASLSSGSPLLLVFVAAMIAGWWIAARLPASHPP